jgi:hypothetical protein
VLSGAILGSGACEGRYTVEGSELAIHLKNLVPAQSGN